MKNSMISRLAAIAMIATTGIAQVQAQDARRCPNPISTQQIVLTQANYQPNQGFGPLPPNTVLASGPNDTAINKFFRHRFVVRLPGRCCQILSATLTFTVRANQQASGPAAADAGNDSWSLRGANGAAIPGVPAMNGMIWPAGTPAGTTRPITVTLNAQALAYLNSSGGIGLIVQDDTAVQRAVLTVNTCCLNIAVPAAPEPAN